MTNRTDVRTVDPGAIGLLVLNDILFLALIYLLPTLAHWSHAPLYRFEPMRIALLFTILFTGNRKNSYLMAVTIPLFSCFVGGHPVVIKALLMAAELLLNAFLFWKLSDLKCKAPIAALSSIVLSKAAYYSIKYLLIVAGTLEMSLISTSPWIQFLVALALSSLFILKKRKP